MEDRLNRRAEAWAIAGLGAILLVTAGWWALALWPVSAEAEWVVRTREACFGTGPGGMPSVGGWILLAGEPAGMLAILLAVWGRDLRRGLTRLFAGWPGRIALATAGLVLLAALGVTMLRVRTLRAEAAPPVPGDGGGAVAAVDRPAPPLALIDQTGQLRSLAEWQGRPVLLTFAYAHCTAICPAQVQAVLSARRLSKVAPVAVVVTLDPWRDTPARLPAIAAEWRFGSDEFVLGGEPEAVVAALTAWRVRAERDPRTGDIAHASTVYLIGRDGRIRALGLPSARALAAAVDQL